VVVLLNTADAVALMELDSHVGHHGAQGCRLGCSMKGQHKPSSGHYYAIHLRPNGYTIAGCDHPDVDIRNLTEPSCAIYETELQKIIHATDQTDYEKKRKETGISKPSILSGLVKSLTLPVPLCFSIDLMHLLCLNIGELLLPFWHGQLKCDPTDKKDSWDWATLVDDTWIEHGRLVAEATKYFPSFFHCPPCNPVEKISSPSIGCISSVLGLVSFALFSPRNIGGISATCSRRMDTHATFYQFCPSPRSSLFSHPICRGIRTLVLSTAP